jgi:acetamidase/formamidase
VAVGVGSDRMRAARDAIREMIDPLMPEYRLSAGQCYCPGSLAVHLKLGEGIDASNWVVSARWPRGICR